MRLSATGTLLLCVITAQAALAWPGSTANAARTTTAAGYVVVLSEDVDDPTASIERLERAAGFSADRTYDTALEGFAARLSDAQVAQLRGDPDVLRVVVDLPFRADAVTSVTAKEAVPPGIRRVRAATTTQASVAADGAVAVLDTGLDTAHADLNAVSGVNCIKPGTAAEDDHGHGTHVAGTLAGRNTGAGVVGVAPGTKLYAVKVLDRRASGSLSSILCGVDRVTKNAAGLGIKVANMSLAASGRDDGACGEADGDVRTPRSAGRSRAAWCTWHRRATAARTSPLRRRRPSARS